MVERTRFELVIQLPPETCLAGKRFRPLSHLSLIVFLLSVDKVIKGYGIHLLMQVFSLIICGVVAMALVFDVKVIPSSGSFGFFRDKNGELKCHLKSAPEKGQANRELLKGLAKLLKIPQNDIEIIAGDIIRKKKIKIHTALPLEQLCACLNVSVQVELFA